MGSYRLFQGPDRGTQLLLLLSYVVEFLLPPLTRILHITLALQASQQPTEDAADYGATEGIKYWYQEASHRCPFLLIWIVANCRI
jgi:hypothetical protein